jgi:hypothetical protein
VRRTTMTDDTSPTDHQDENPPPPDTPQLRDDGTVFPPVTPDPPAPPGYRSPLEDHPALR